MTRDDYLAILKRALSSPHGIRLTYPDDLTAKRVRAKLYAIRGQVRLGDQRRVRPTPALRYNSRGRLVDVVEIRGEQPQPATPFDDLRFRLDGCDLYIIHKPENEKAEADGLPASEPQELGGWEVGQLSKWPPL
jgi:hypothetical protein